MTPSAACLPHGGTFISARRTDVMFIPHCSIRVRRTDRTNADRFFASVPFCSFAKKLRIFLRYGDRSHRTNDFPLLPFSFRSRHHDKESVLTQPFSAFGCILIRSVGFADCLLRKPSDRFCLIQEKCGSKHLFEGRDSSYQNKSYASCRSTGTGSLNTEKTADWRSFCLILCMKPATVKS